MAAGALTDLEVATGGMFGLEPGAAELEPARTDYHEVFGDVLQPHLERGRCFVWFTGDLGGALTLAAGVRRARREGLELPIPITMDTEPGLPDDPHVVEVMRVLGLTEWERVDAVGRLGLLDEAARPGLLRHGVRFPSIGHVVVPLAEAARGGTVVECHGIGEIWDFWRAAPLRAELHRRRLRPRHLARTIVWAAPGPGRRRLVRQRWGATQSAHLRPVAQDWLRQQFESQAMSIPLSASAAILRLHRRRCLWQTARTFSRLGEDVGAELVHPFMDPRMVATVAGDAGRFGWPAVTALAQHYAPELPRSRPRAIEPSVFWDGPETRAFVEAWDETGVPEELVFSDRVRAAWRDEHSRTGALLQAAWLASPAGLAARRADSAPVAAA
jgi:asparagine synthase (glutamine-hydrolysing)